MAIFSLQIPVLRIIVRAGARPVFATASLEEKNYTKKMRRSTIQKQRAEMVHSLFHPSLFMNSMGGLVPP
jgi:hypothetical protein